jgi:nicotinamide-nucleotide amidase
LAGLLATVLAWADLVMITGGLGPTEDDITRDAVAKVVGLEMAVDEQIVERLRERFAKRGIKMTDNNRRQAMVPRGARVLENPNGSAPGLWITHGQTDLILLPGPPREMAPMLDAFVREHLAPRAGARCLVRRTLKITGRPESEVDSMAQPVYTPWLKLPVPISTTILASLGQIELHLTASARTAGEAADALDRAVLQLRDALGPSVYSVDGSALEAVVGELLFERGLTIAVAESCSGGLLASRLTDVPGSSRYFQRGVVCYSNQAKTELLDVPDALLREHGAVSEPVAPRDGRRYCRPSENERRRRHHRHRRPRRRHAGKAGRNRRHRGDRERGHHGSHVEVVWRPRNDQVPVGAGGDEHAALNAPVTLCGSSSRSTWTTPLAHRLPPNKTGCAGLVGRRFAGSSRNICTSPSCSWAKSPNNAPAR